MVKRAAAGGPGVGLAARVARLSRLHGLFPEGAPVLVMVSGGQDSVALLHLLARGPIPGVTAPQLQALHVNHGLRGTDSDADVALVADLCRELGVALRVVDGRLPAGANLQERARLVRRAAALELLGELQSLAGPCRVATGHTLDDQVETLLYRLGRYGGLAALDGLRPLQEPWVRPLLQTRREDTADYCRAHGLAFAVDRGNESEAYARTGIRRRVVPVWERELPGAVAAAGRAAEVAAETRDALGCYLDEIEGLVGVGSEGDRAWSALRLATLPEPLLRAFLHRFLTPAAGPGDRPGNSPGLPRRTVLNLADLVRGSGGEAEVDLGGGRRARRRYGLLEVVQGATAAEGGGSMREDAGDAARPPAAAEVRLPVPGSVAWAGLVLRAELTDSFRAPVAAREAYLDAAVLGGRDSVAVRGVRSGDRMRPLGGPGSRKVQDILVDHKVPASERGRIPVVLLDDQILWLGGYRLGREGRISRQTKGILRLSLEEEASPR